MRKKRQNMKWSYSSSTIFQTDNNLMQRAAFGRMQLQNVITADFNDEATRAEQDVRSFEGNFGAKTRRVP
jgi:hypothetical protein